MDKFQKSLEVKDLKVYFSFERSILDRLFFKNKHKSVHAVDGISFDIYKGETLGLVGESGCGKTTTGRAILRLNKPITGEINFNGRNINDYETRGKYFLYREMQFIYQDPAASLNPRMKVKDIIGRTLENYNIAKGEDREKKVQELLKTVGLQPRYADRYPYEFSGGQKQRIGIARAIATEPKFIVADEPISSLDVSIQAQIINLLIDLKEKFNLTLLFITHDLSVAKYMSDRIAVMYLGKIVELAETQELFNNPLHPYTKALLSAAPEPDPVVRQKMKTKTISLKGEVPSAITLTSGCHLHPRCPYAVKKCIKEEPRLIAIKEGHYVACHLFCDCDM